MGGARGGALRVGGARGWGFESELCISNVLILTPLHNVPTRWGWGGALSRRGRGWGFESRRGKGWGIE